MVQKILLVQSGCDFCSDAIQKFKEKKIPVKVVDIYSEKGKKLADSLKINYTPACVAHCDHKPVELKNENEWFDKRKNVCQVS